MNTSLIARVLWRRRFLRRRERWSHADLRVHQLRQLARLRTFTLQRSPFYRQFHAGDGAAPLDQLPVLTKATLMDNFDTIATDPAVRLADIETYLANLRDDGLFAGKYWVAATSGSSGRRSIIPTDTGEWAAVIASYARANEWAGIRADPLHRVSMAVVSSTTAWHQSARVAATVRSPFIAARRLDAASPMHDIVAELNAMQPTVLVAYASMIRALAEEQLSGRLRITPRAVNASSEVLTGEARTMATEAWRVAPFNVYAATETGGIAAECSHHHGMHLFEDLVITEVVDDRYQPVPPGESGDRLLVTVLSSRTLPLIRYELTDRVRLASHPCDCGLPFRIIDAIEGRTDDALRLSTPDGSDVEVHPIVFHRVLDLVDGAGWQVRQEPQRLLVLISGPAAGIDRDSIARAVRDALATAGAQPPPIEVTVVDDIPAGAAGKRPLVVALRAQVEGAPPTG
jgi:putative adenylate-forming enzyme